MTKRPRRGGDNIISAAIGRVRLTALSAANEISSSFWFVPGLISLTGLTLAAWSVWLHGASPDYGQQLPVRFSVEGARSILATIAGSVMTAASVIFSITFLALSVAAQQLGPRIINMLMRDRMTQVTLGVFNATFLHALLVLAATSAIQEQQGVPTIAILIALALAIASFSLVILFVHTIALRLQADAVVAQLADDLNRAIRSLAIRNGENADCAEDAHEASAIRHEGAPVLAQKSGYVQWIDYEAALAKACELDSKLVFVCAPGDFVLQGRPLFYADKNDEALCDLERDCLKYGARRSAVGNISFELNAVSDVAMRALSPSLNDPNTAVTCIHHLSDALAILLRNPMRSMAHCDEENTRRVFERGRGFQAHAATVFSALVPAVQGSPIASAALMDALYSLEAIADDPADIAVLRQWRREMTRARRGEQLRFVVRPPARDGTKFASEG